MRKIPSKRILFFLIKFFSPFLPSCTLALLTTHAIAGCSLSCKSRRYWTIIYHRRIFRRLIPEHSGHSGDGNVHERTLLFFFTNGNSGPCYRAKPRHQSERNRARRVITRKYGQSPPIHHAVIDGKAKPLNAPNYLVNRAKCTTPTSANDK